MIRKIPQSPSKSDKLGESQKWYDGKGTTFFFNPQTISTFYSIYIGIFEAKTIIHSFALSKLSNCNAWDWWHGPVPVTSRECRIPMNRPVLYPLLKSHIETFCCKSNKNIITRHIFYQNFSPLWHLLYNMAPCYIKSSFFVVQHNTFAIQKKGKANYFVW